VTIYGREKEGASLTKMWCSAVHFVGGCTSNSGGGGEPYERDTRLADCIERCDKTAVTTKIKTRKKDAPGFFGKKKNSDRYDEATNWTYSIGLLVIIVVIVVGHLETLKHQGLPEFLLT
jgi:hypothetical protein